MWERDLANLSSLSINNKFKYILNVKDIFSRYAWSAPIKDKTGTSITTALTFLFPYRNLLTIQPEKCTEFVNATVRKSSNIRELVFIPLTIPT